MSEGKVISMTKQPNTICSIYENLKKTGISDGDILLVHSSLSSLGWVCGGAQAVISALMKLIGKNGTLVMPAHSGNWSDPAEWTNPPVPKNWIETIYNTMPAFNLKITPTLGMGCIPELFRTFPNTMRSNHPQVSFCANGKYATVITENHPLSPQFGIYSPLGKMYNLKIKVLLLGVDYDSCTSFHLAESLIDKMPVKRTGAALLKNDKRCWKWFEDYDYDPDDFLVLGKDFEKKYDVQKCIIGNAQCKVFKMNEAVDFAKEWLINNRFSD